MNQAQKHPDHDHSEPPSELELRLRALESLLLEKGLVEAAALNELIDTLINSSKKMATKC